MCSCNANWSVTCWRISFNHFVFISSLWAIKINGKSAAIGDPDFEFNSNFGVSGKSLISTSGNFIIFFKTNTERSSDIRRTLQIKSLALNRKIYLSLVFPSLSVIDHHSCDKSRPNFQMFPKKFFFWNIIFKIFF